VDKSLQSGPRAAAAPGAAPRIHSLLVKPVSALCNLDCAYCFYRDRDSDPYGSAPLRRMSDETLEQLIEGYLFYSYPNSLFAFQGGEPMLAGRAFFERLIEYQKRYARGGGHAISNILQTNGVLLDDSWCRMLKEYRWLVGVSLDGPEAVHDRYRRGKPGGGTWKDVIRGLEALRKNGVEQHNVLCAVSQANVERAAELFKFFRSLGIDYIQHIPVAERDGAGRLLPFSITPEQYGRFLSETFDLWWPERRTVRVRNFDSIAEAIAGQPSSCTMRETCDSYAVVESNGDVYPCDFFVEKSWILGNIAVNSWSEIARSRRRYAFAAQKSSVPGACGKCEYQAICRGGCPKYRFDRQDYFCRAYQTIFGKAVPLLVKELASLWRALDRD
jgi:uncharacterized protein